MTSMKEILEEARKIYQSTQCATGCCGNFDGALEYIDGAMGELISDTVDEVEAGQDQ